MRIRIAVIKTGDEWVAYGDNELNDVQNLTFIEDNYKGFTGEVHFVEVDLPERLLHVTAEVVP